MHRILLMPDKRGWAFDFFCSYAAEALRKRGWHVDVIYQLEKTEPPLPLSRYDIAFNPSYMLCKMDRELRGRLVRGIYGHKWEWSLNPRRKLDQSLRGAFAVIVPNRELQAMIRWYFPRTYQVCEGTDPDIFRFVRHRTGGDLVAGWSGNPRHPWKRFYDIIVPACEKAEVELRVATNLTREELCAFYNDVDVVLVATRGEGSPNCVFEAGACGRPVIGTAAGIIPEAVVDGRNGFIVDGTVEAFIEKLVWCKANIGQLREMGLAHHDVVLKEYTIQEHSERFADLMEQLLCDMETERQWSTKVQRVTTAGFREIRSFFRKLRSDGQS